LLVNILPLRGPLGIEELEQICRQAKDKRTAERLRAIYLRAAGKTPPEIAAIVGRHTETVRRWIKQFNDGGPERLEYRHTGGQVRKLSPEFEKMLAIWLTDGRPDGGRWTLSALSEKLLQEHSIKISPQQISERIVAIGLNHRIARPRTRAQTS
jgi:transposase